MQENDGTAASQGFIMNNGIVKQDGTHDVVWSLRLRPPLYALDPGISGFSDLADKAKGEAEKEIEK